MKENQRIKICFILLKPVVGGNETFMFNLIRNLDRERFQITFILLNAEGENSGSIPKDIDVIDLGMSIPEPNQLTNPYWIFKLANIFRRVKPNVIFSTSGYPNLITILAKRVSMSQAFLVIREITTRSKLLKSDRWYKFKQWAYHQIYSKADMIVAPSENILKDLGSFVNLSNKKTKLIPNFINESFVNKKLKEQLSPEKFGLKFDKPIIISVSRLTEEKGIDLGIRAFAKVKQKIPCNYWIVGNGSEESRLKNIAAELGLNDSIYFLGYQDNPYIFLQKADVFLLPSRFEGFPNALLEAMYLGIPSVVSRYDESIAKFLEHGTAGILAETENSDSISEALEKLINDLTLKKQIQEAAQAKIKTYHTDNIVIKQYENLFIQHAKI